MTDVSIIDNDVNDNAGLAITELHKTVSNLDTPKILC